MTQTSFHGKPARLIDLSALLSNSTSAFEPNPHSISYVSHEEGAATGRKMLGLSEEEADTVLRRGHLWGVESVTLSTHSGTHIDAPWHYGPKMSDGTRPLQIHEVPLDWCFGPGVLLDFTKKQAGEGISAADVEQELQRIGHALQPGDIVLTHTGVSQHFHEPGYAFKHAGYTRDGLAYLVDRGVRLIGIDAWGIDRPFNHLIEEAKAGKAEFWEAHFYGLEKPYLQIEKLANLDQLPASTGFTVMAFPVKLEGASAGWARVVALVEENTP